MIEYKDYPLKLRVARGSGLPEEWGDLPSSVYKIAKSWKHNSKRRNQHYKNSNKIEMIHMQNINETLDGIVKKI